MAVIVKIGIIFVLAFIGLLMYVRFLESTTVFLPSLEILQTPKSAGLNYEDIYFRTQDDVELNGWLVKSLASPSTSITMIFFHGNAGNIGDRVEKIDAFSRMGMNVFIVDYRGYGNSKGKPSEEGMYKDARAAYDYLSQRTDIDHNKIILYGASLGGAAAVDLAQHRKVAGLILDSTFTSAADMGKIILPIAPSFLLSIKLDSASKIKDMKVPKLFIHSPEDETVPFVLGKRLYEKASEPKEFLVINGTHNEGYLESRVNFLQGIDTFLKRIF